MLMTTLAYVEMFCFIALRADLLLALLLILLKSLEKLTNIITQFCTIRNRCLAMCARKFFWITRTAEFLFTRNRCRIFLIQRCDQEHQNSFRFRAYLDAGCLRLYYPMHRELHGFLDDLLPLGNCLELGRPSLAESLGPYLLLFLFSLGILCGHCCCTIR